MDPFGLAQKYKWFEEADDGNLILRFKEVHLASDLILLPPLLPSLKIFCIIERSASWVDTSNGQQLDYNVFWWFSTPKMLIPSLVSRFLGNFNTWINWEVWDRRDVTEELCGSLAIQAFCIVSIFLLGFDVVIFRIWRAHTLPASVLFFKMALIPKAQGRWGLRPWISNHFKRRLFWLFLEAPFVSKLVR